MIAPNLIDPPAFAEVVIGSRAEQPCSPPFPDMHWRGVAIAAPKRVRTQAGTEPVLPVCGTFMLPVHPDHIRLRGVIHLRVEGMPAIAPQPIGLEDPEDEAGPAPTSLTEEEMRTMAEGGHFAFDAARFVALPRYAARIDIVLQIDGVLSAPVVVRWDPDPLARPAL